jgi:glycosyltransferase involved in cell wall biosynthesis
LKILLLTGKYLPEKNGGIENYTHRLALLLKQQEYEVEVAALNLQNKNGYTYEGIKVNNLMGSIEVFEKLLQGSFDICHFHEYSSSGGIEIPWFTKAKEYCRKVFFTFHLPYLTCYKNDFRYEGIEDCNHFTDAERCTGCIITERLKKYNEPDWLLKPVKIALALTGKKRMLKSNVELIHKQLNELIGTCDEIFVIANWFEKLLKENGYNSNKIKLLPNIIQPCSILNKEAVTGVQKKRMVFVGRIQQQKGLHLLCKAMQKTITKRIEIDVYGNVVEENYFKKCQHLFSFNYKGSIAREELLALLPNYDFLVLPSVFTEMYPMVIQEAFSIGLPVIASAAKGNRDVIVDEVNGFLFEYDDPKDLAKTIDKAYQLKGNGWMPDFSYSDHPEKDIEEIVSYYK